MSRRSYRQLAAMCVAANVLAIFVAVTVHGPANIALIPANVVAIVVVVRAWRRHAWALEDD